MRQPARFVRNAACTVLLLALVAGATGARPLAAQQLVTRAQAIAAARARGPRVAIARADTSAAHALILGARAIPNPALSASYSKDSPQYHAIVDLPLDYPWLRAVRIRSADAARRAAKLRFQFELAAAAFDADTAYTRALAAAARARLSRGNAQAADSLRRFAEIRRDAGDASELDVQLATVNAGQQANLAIGDSLTLLSALLDVQATMGLGSENVSIAVADSLVVPPIADDGGTSPSVTLSVAAATSALHAAEFALRTQKRSAFPLPSLQGGVEAHDPAGGESGLLPTFGLGLSLPLFDRNRGPIAAAEAERERAAAELAVARLESATRLGRARRERDVAFARLTRDRALLESANRVAAMSLTAYREGAATLPSVLEAQRVARDVLGQYIDDVASAWIAGSTLRLFLLSETPE
jgi:cobalt-zinc-cadmium efflux system outer membrane protein